MVRKFSLINRNNATWDFTDPAEKVFARNPAGLGLVKSAELLRLGNKQKVVDEQYEFVNKTFDVLFYGDTREKMYSDYNDFIDFITVGDISLLYEIPSQNVAYRISVLVSEITKTEVKENGIMSCGLTLTPLSFWEDNIPNKIIAGDSSDVDGKHYLLDRKTGEGYYYAEMVDLRNIEINIVGNLEVPFKVTVNGFSTDPYFAIINEQTGDPVQRCMFLGSYNYVYVNSDEAEEEIQLKDQYGQDVEYPYNYQVFESVYDYEKVTFLTLKKGHNLLRFNLGTLFDGTATIEWRNRYVSV